MRSRMETPFYHDDTPGVHSFSHFPDYDRYPGNKMLSKKAVAMASGHHFSGGGSAGGRGPSHANVMMTSSTPTGTSSADVNLLKLASPDLEHLIIQSSQGLVTTSPGNPFMYRGQATNEQEGFADGFVKALADLHKQNQLVGGSMSPSSSNGLQSYQRNLMSGADGPVYTNLGSYGAAQMSYAGGAMMYGGGSGHLVSQNHNRNLDAPQTVPEVPHPGDPSSPPSLSPVDPETQERIKVERKKLRNRIAASKCRRRKLERISRLEEKVKVLKNQNSDLASTAAVLREQVASLKQKVMSHVTNGCQISSGSRSGGRGASRAGSQDSSC